MAGLLCVIDTHALFWNFTNSAKLSVAASTVFGDAGRGMARLIVPHIVLAELFFVLQKHGESNRFKSLVEGMERSSAYEFDAGTLDDTLALSRLTDIPEMHDRMIAAHAVRLNCPILTNDARLRASQHIRCIW